MASPQKRIRNGKVRWVARWRDADGRDKSKTFDRRVDALRYGVAAEAASRTGQSPADTVERDKITVDEWLDEWLDIVATRCAAGQLAPTTAAGYESKVRVHLSPRIGHLRLSALTRGHVEDVMTDVMAAGRSAGSARAVRAVLSKALSDAEGRGLVDRNIAASAVPPELDRGEPSAFTPDEFDAIISQLDGGTYGRVLRFMVLTGLRTSEALGLRWDDVDLDGGVYQIAETAHRIPKAAARVVPRTGTVAGRGKTKAARRPTRMSSAAVDLLRDQRRDQAAQRLAAPAWVDTDVVFASEVGTRLMPSNVRRALRRAMDRAGVDPVGKSGRGRGLHELRRTFATQLLAEGVPIHVVQRLGRWSSPQVLMDSYAGVADEAQSDAAEALARRLGG